MYELDKVHLIGASIHGKILVYLTSAVRILWYALIALTYVPLVIM